MPSMQGVRQGVRCNKGEGGCGGGTGDEGGGEGGKFQESDGTGMGEGEGVKDVSDQIEDEDQLLGAQQKDAPQEDQDRPDQVLCGGVTGGV
jgi:hypothetical protein